jgi:CRP-like cAMP-binding protein
MRFSLPKIIEPTFSTRCFKPLLPLGVFPGKVLTMAVTNEEFNLREYLTHGGIGKTILQIRANECIFCQGDAGDSVFYLQKGRFMLTIVSPTGKEATIQILNAGQFVGEECIAPEPTERCYTARALSDCTLLRIKKSEMFRVLSEEPRMARLLIRYFALQKARMQAELVNHLFYTSEKRLARTLLQLAQPGKDAASRSTIPRIRQETLAEMIGTTRSRVSYFMNRFRKKGFIEYEGLTSIWVNDSLRGLVPSL